MPMKHEHDQLRDMMGRFALLMADPTAENRAAMLRERVAFSQLFSRHCLAEQAAFRAHAASPSGQALRPAVRAQEQRLSDLRTCYSAHVNNWTPGRIAEDWDQYKTAVLGLQKQLHALLDWEEAHLSTIP